MRLKSLFLILLALLCAGAYAQDKRLESGNVEVYYDAKYEAQAKKVLGTVAEPVSASLTMSKRTAKLLSDTEGLSNYIVTLLAAPEQKTYTKNELDRYDREARAFIKTFSKFKLISKDNAVKTKGIDAGVVTVRYDEEKDDFNMVIETNAITEEMLDRSYMPVIINSDGSIRSEDKLVGIALLYLGSGDRMSVVPVHKTVSLLVEDKLRFYNPMTRWFTEGVSSYVTVKAVEKYNPELKDVLREMFVPDEAAAKSRDLINLYATPQANFENRQDPHYSVQKEIASAKYIYELMTKILGANGEKLLPEIVKPLKYVGNPENAKIFAAADKVTGKNTKEMLLEYSPANVKSEAGSKAAADGLVKRAEEAAKGKDYEGCSKLLWDAIQIYPEDSDLYFNHAWAERMCGRTQNAETRIVLGACFLKEGKASANFIYPEDKDCAKEGLYIMGRLCVLFGDLKNGEMIFNSILKYYPDHKDAKNGLEQIKRITGAK